MYLYLILLFSARAEMLNFDVEEKSKSFFTLKDVCQVSIKHPSPLIEKFDSTTVDCMGSLVNVSQFCAKKKADDAYYARAYITKENKVVCQSAKRITLSYSCRLKDRFCGQANEGCEKLRAKLAGGLVTSYSGLVDRDDGKKVLNCFFEAKVINNLPKSSL